MAVVSALRAVYGMASLCGAYRHTSRMAGMNVVCFLSCPFGGLLGLVLMIVIHTPREYVT